jgi:signal transduction histidine kinase
VIAECLAAGAPILRRSVQITQGGRDSHFGVTVSPLLAESGRGAICLFSDLTAVMELEEQLRLKEALARVGELTAGLAHEFRNGLATIHGYSRLIATEALPPQYQTYLQAIRHETETLGDVVTNFLNFARPDKVTLSRVPLAPLVQRAADDLRRELPAGTTIETVGEFCEIDGDEVLLRQVVGNLIRNAAEACTEAGKTPAISIAGLVDRSRRTSSLSVRDNGPGIPAADRERVFQPFFTTRSRGTGLGLAVVQKIVVTLNGRVAVSTSPAGGASIDLTFPAA